MISKRLIFSAATLLSMHIATATDYHAHRGGADEDRGAIGVAYEKALYYKNDVACLKLTSIDGNSNFTALHVGDCVYSVDDAYFKSPDDLVNIISQYSPGDAVKVAFFDSTENYKAYSQTSRLVALRHDPDDTMADESQPKPAISSPTSEQTQDDANMHSSLDALLQRDSTGWWGSKYVPGSVRDAQTFLGIDRSLQTVTAAFSYKNGESGEVAVNIRDGKLECVGYSDEGYKCRSVHDSSALSDGVVAAVLVAAAVAVAVAVSSSKPHSNTAASNGSYPSGAGHDYDSMPQQPRPKAQQQPENKEDTSIGCAWGDRAYGTCQ